MHYCKSMPWPLSSRDTAPRRRRQPSQVVQQPVPDNSPEEGRTTYWSANREEQKTFIADAPVGSQHAARLRKIALQNQPEYGRFETESQQRLEPRGQSRLKIEAEPAQRARNSNGWPSLRSRKGTKYPDAHGRPQRDPYSNLGDRTTERERKIRRDSPPRVATLPTRVDRYEENGQVAYHKQGLGSKLVITAPKGSLEARSMDYAAAQYLAAQRRHPTGQVSIPV